VKIKYLKDEISYDGSQLSPLYAFKNHAVEGASTIAFVGSCDVTDENMKDGEDLFAGESIQGNKMLHFIVEFFEKPLFSMVLAQRLFASIVKDELESLSQERILREGDDLYFDEGKLSISIATRGAVSSMIHFAINVTNDGTPVKTSSLEDLKIEVDDFANRVLEKWQTEISSVNRACEKVFSL
jgi:hypothetical protein